MTEALIQEIPILFNCRADALAGILHRPAQTRRVGVVIVVGGPQYRVGSHRQFLLMARYLAAQGYTVFRFDCRGMGDSSGEFPGFERISDDIRAAVDTLCHQVPDLSGVVLWGLCDAASAALMYGTQDPRVIGLALLNPWVRSETTLARAYLRNYYLERLLSREFWHKLASGRLNPARVLGDLAGNIRAGASSRCVDENRDFISRMLDGLREFNRPILLVLSGNDITAAEFSALARSSPWNSLLRRAGISRFDIREANHTFATALWRDEVAGVTGRWLLTLERSAGGESTS